MLHTVRFLSKTIVPTFLIIAGCTLSGCSLFDKRPSAHAQMAKINKQRVFYANYDSVWRAAHAVLRYPIAQENQDTGMIETEYIKGVDGWLPPHKDRPPSSGIRYKIQILFAKGTTDGRESTRVTVDKKVEILRDFFSEPEVISSDGLEEKIIFYRIERELIIQDALKRASN